jgi:hypothetical protein
MTEDQQLTLAGVEVEDEGRLLLPDDVVRKRYTARQLQKDQRAKEAVAMLLASGWSMEEIATRLRLSYRTVRALREHELARVAGDAKGLALSMRARGVGWIMDAEAKRESAPFRDQVAGAGVLLTHANALEDRAAAMGLRAEKTAAANGAKIEVRDLARLFEVEVTIDPSPPPDSESEGTKPERQQIEGSVVAESNRESNPPPAEGDPDPATTAEPTAPARASEGGGGG